MTAEKRATKTRSIIGFAGALVILVAGLLVSSLLTESPTENNKEAFGKLPAMAQMMMAKTEALGLPVDNGDFQQPEYEYKWTGGDWPDLPEAMLVYRRADDKTDLAETKALAAKFGLTGEPQPAEPIRPVGTEEQAVEGSAGSASTAETRAEPVEEEPDIEVEMLPEPDVEAPLDQPVGERPNYYRFYDQDSGKSLEIYGGATTFSYHDEGLTEKIYKSAGEAPTESEARQAAVDFLDNKGLLPPDHLEPVFGSGGAISTIAIRPDDAGVVTSEPQIGAPPQTPPVMEVNFGRKLGRFELVGYSGEVNQYVVSVTVGPNGAIMSASGEIPGPLEESEYPLIRPETAFDAISGGPYLGGPAMGVPEPLGMPEPMIAPGERPVSSDLPDDFVEPDPDTPIQSLPTVEDPGGAAEDSEAENAGSGTAGTVGEPAEPPTAETEPPAKPDPIVIEVDQVKMGYLQSYDDRGFTFYVPAYIFSGKMTGDGDNPFSVAIPAVKNE